MRLPLEARANRDSLKLCARCTTVRLRTSSSTLNSDNILDRGLEFLFRHVLTDTTYFTSPSPLPVFHGRNSLRSDCLLAFARHAAVGKSNPTLKPFLRPTLLQRKRAAPFFPTSQSAGYIGPTYLSDAAGKHRHTMVIPLRAHPLCPRSSRVSVFPSK